MGKEALTPDPPPPSQVLGLQVCATMPASFLFFQEEKTYRLDGKVEGLQISYKKKMLQNLAVIEINVGEPNFCLAKVNYINYINYL